MPFRAKIKRAFGSSTPEYDPSNPLTHAPSKKSKRDYPDNVYKPGEAMPRPKYRGPWNQAHQDKLSAFSFSNAWNKRKASSDTVPSANGPSDYSPMGSRRPSWRGSRRGSAWSAFSGKGPKRPRGLNSRQHSGHNAQDDPMAERVEENETGDDDVMNVGLSRKATNENVPPPPPPKDDPPRLNGMTQQKKKKRGLNKERESFQPLDPQKTISQGELFTPEELAQALSQSTLKPDKTKL